MLKKLLQFESCFYQATRASSFYFFGGAWDDSVEYHFQMSGLVSATHNQTFTATLTVSEGALVLVSPPTAASKAQNVPLLLKGFLVISTTRLSSAARFHPSSLASFSTQQTYHTPFPHTHNAEGPVFRAPHTKPEKITNRGRCVCEVNRGKNNNKRREMLWTQTD